MPGERSPQLPRVSERVSERALGWLIVLAASALVLGVQALAPVGVPLYDGVVVQEPYRHLHPAAGQAGDPTSFAKTEPVVGGASPQVPAATLESPPQAQLIMLTGALELPAGARSISISVTPVEAPAEPAGGQILGNVYRFSVTDQAGTPLAIKPCDGCVSLVMRAPEDNTSEARLQRYANGTWSEVETVHAGILGMYATNPTALGDYAIVAGAGPGASGAPRPSGGDPGGGDGVPTESLIVAGGAAIVLAFLFTMAILARRRQPSAPPGAPARPVPAKRKRPTKPPRRPDP